MEISKTVSTACACGGWSYVTTFVKSPLDKSRERHDKAANRTRKNKKD